MKIDPARDWKISFHQHWLFFKIYYKKFSRGYNHSPRGWGAPTYIRNLLLPHREYIIICSICSISFSWTKPILYIYISNSIPPVSLELSPNIIVSSAYKEHMPSGMIIPYRVAPNICNYPLVNVYIAIENHHFSWENPL